MMKRTAAALVTALAAGTLAIGAPTQALTKTYSDPREAPAAADVRSVTYRDAEFVTKTTVRVRDLRRAGRLNVVITVPDGVDFNYEAQSWINPDGSLGKRLVFVDEGIGSRAKRCPGLKATWSASTDRASITVPHSCMGLIGFHTREYFQARFRAKSHTDYAAGRIVGRGSSPGCVTQGEYEKITKGMQMGRVHAIFDAAGSWAASAPAKFYRICGVSGPIAVNGVEVEYRRSAGHWIVLRKFTSAE